MGSDDADFFAVYRSFRDEYLFEQEKKVMEIPLAKRLDHPAFHALNGALHFDLVLSRMHFKIPAWKEKG